MNDEFVSKLISRLIDRVGEDVEAFWASAESKHFFEPPPTPSAEVTYKVDWDKYLQHVVNSPSISTTFAKLSDIDPEIIKEIRDTTPVLYGYDFINRQTIDLPDGSKFVYDQSVTPYDFYQPIVLRPMKLNVATEAELKIFLKE